MLGGPPLHTSLPHQQRKTLRPWVDVSWAANPWPRQLRLQRQGLPLCLIAAAPAALHASMHAPTRQPARPQAQHRQHSGGGVAALMILSRRPAGVLLLPTAWPRPGI